MKLYNTLTKSKQEFKPLKDKKVGLYTCGPTVYNFAHLGNLRAYVFEDVLKRTLIYLGYKVKHIMNITDVGHLTSDSDSGEDKLEKGAQREKKSPLEIAKFYTQKFKQDIAKLNIIPPDKYCPATEHIDDMIKMIKKIEENGFTYETKQALYFDVTKYKDYTRLSGQKLEQKMTGARKEIKTDPDKKHPADFALWFKRVGHFKNHILHWDSPWGDGFPGWHIECSAMSTKYLGNEFDIHCGGVDHIPVHHTNERAQNFAATGKETVKFWLHNEFLNMGSEKMAKSGENFLTLQTIIDKGFNPLAYRYFLLGAHYRQPIKFSWQALEAAQNALNKLYDFFSCHPEGSEVMPEDKGSKTHEKNKKLNAKQQNPSSPLLKVGAKDDFRKKFIKYISDNLNTPKALALIWKIIKSNLDYKDKKELLLDFDQVLGLGLNKIKPVKLKIPEQVKELVKKREEARKKKNWQLADQLREKINKKGFLIEDTASGPVIKKL